MAASPAEEPAAAALSHVLGQQHLPLLLELEQLCLGTRSTLLLSGGRLGCKSKGCSVNTSGSDNYM